MSILKDIKEARIQINILILDVSNEEELEGIIKPEYLRNAVSELGISFNDTIMLTDTFFENMNQIWLKEISLRFTNKVTYSFDIIRILKKSSTKYQNKSEI